MKVKLLLFLMLVICTTEAVFGQIEKVTGKVSDLSGKPLDGATVAVKGTNKKVMTNPDGNYAIEAQKGDQLIFSMVGALNETRQVEGNGPLNVQMNLNFDLDEVVVTGYTSEKKADITGAVAVVKMKDISSIPAGNVMSTLQGRLPGVSVSTDGTPGGVNTGTAIRGITTINNSSPLYVIDGVQTRSNIATLLNPSDIESIQVLKDAASASIYGTQAANGVIIITTKKAKRDQTTVTFDAQLSAQTFNTGIHMLNAQQWGDVYWKAYQNDGIKPVHDLYGSGDSPVIPEFIDLAKTIRAGNTNWADEVYETAIQQNYNVSIAKGGQNGSSTFSLNYFDQDGLVKYTNFRRFNARFNSDYSFLNNRVRIGENANISKWDEKLKPGGIEELTIAQHPIIPVYDINGGYAGPTQGIGDKPNPVRLLDQQRQNRLSQWRIFGNMFAEVEPIKNLVFRSNFGVNYRTGFQSNFEPKWSEGSRSNTLNSLTTRSDYDLQWIWSNTVAYKATVGDHSINALAGIEAKETRIEWLDAKRENFLLENEDYRYLNAGEGKQTNGGTDTTTTMNSYFAKVNYAYKDRYLLSATVRRDASSRFGTQNNAGVFPAVSAGWRISQENFMKSVSLINDLKLRASWGQNGNDLLDNEATYTKYATSIGAGGYDMNGINNGVIQSGIIKLRTGNPNITWEKTTQSNIGLDVTMLSNKLAFTFDYFIKKTKDMLIDRPYIAIIGEGGDMAYNGASMKNTGFEGIVSWNDKIGNDFSYELTFTASVYRNKITDLPADIYYTWGNGNGRDLSIVGQPFGSWMGYKTNGLYRTEEELNDGIVQEGKGLGRIRYVDLNGDGIVNDNDRTWLGSDQPKFTGGLNVSLGYKAFDLSFFLTGMVRDAWNNARFYTDFFQLWTGNHGTRLLEAWDPQHNFNADIPALTAVNLNDEGRSSGYFIESGSYIKMKNLQIGYTLPHALSDKLKMRNLRVYLQGQNLFTITGYTGADPEGLGYPYPMPRVYTFGLNVGF
ncbi:MAG TPA: TonB-dependent receptor [Pseudosphingobacterium sp.]|nr:TonB-dependent receptor [Pseudosphingobacterium sp.]